MKPKTREILARAIEDGIIWGLSRAYKHTDKPTKEQIAAETKASIWLEIDSVFVVDNGE